jgi:hypothetical protein
MLIRNVILVGFFFFLLACKGNKKAAKDQQSEQVKVEAVTDSISRLIVSFISIGGGIDRNAKSQFLQFTDQYKAANNVRIEWEVSGWGREGETDYCLKLNELNEQQQNEFISGLKNLLNSSKLVRYYEYEVCRGRRRK